MSARFSLAAIMLVLPLNGQELVSPLSLRFEAVNNGLVLNASQALTIRASGGWSVHLGAGLDDMVALDKTKGSGNGVVLVSVPGWWVVRRPPGTYEQRISIVPEGTSLLPANTLDTVAIFLKVVAAAPPPQFSYPQGPVGCTRVPALPDLATCLVADERPPEMFEPPAVGRSYTDGNFGARVTVLSRPGVLHGYSSPTAITVGNRSVLVGKSGESQLIDLRSGEMQRKSLPVPMEG